MLQGSRVFQGRLKHVSLEFISVSRVKKVKWVFEESFKCGTRMFHRSFTGISRKIERCSQRPSSVIQKSFGGIYNKVNLKCVFKEVSRQF